VAALPTDPGRFKEVRAALLDDTAVTGPAWCQRYSAAADEWVTALLEQATGGDSRHVALLAVGGYGRGELAPGSDLDLLLVYDRRGKIKAIADAIWYPIWDAGVSLDHSVRTPREVRAAMDEDIKVALGLLDARCVAGDRELAQSVLTKALDQWRTRAARWFTQLDAVTRLRHEGHGDLAFLLEPDLKEARGGLRDLNLMRSLSRVVPILAAVVADPALVGAGQVIEAARVELHRTTGRNTDTLLLQDQDAVAGVLGQPDADALMVELAGAGRAIAWANDDAWRRLESWLAGPVGRAGSGDRALEPGLVLRDDEVALLADAPLSTDSTLALRAAAVSAELDRPMARATLDRLSAEAVVPEGVWPAETLQALVRLLGAGRPMVAAVESLDQLGIWLRYLPEWAPVRNRPQRNAYHRFTVDRHLLEAAANAAELTRQVARPDLLLLGALLHDIGKGRGGDHTEIGIGVVRDLGPRLGLNEGDTATVETMVRHHLLLPDVATRRDLDDPATASAVAVAVGDRNTLELLGALTEADSLATGPAAWGPWKAGLVARLVELAGEILAGDAPTERARDGLAPEQRQLLAGGQLDLLADGDHLSVVAPDRAGLLSSVAGVLTLNRVTIRSATTFSDTGTGMALLRFDVAPTFDRLPDWGRVRADLAAALDGRLQLAALLEEREQQYAFLRRATAAAPPRVEVTVDHQGSLDATIVEVRCADRGPVLYRVTGALTGAGLTITSALVNTMGAEAVDVFYVQTAEGGKVRDPAVLEGAVERVRAALAGP
jgi:[protein-PII] uridylyltransferase